MNYFSCKNILENKISCIKDISAQPRQVFFFKNVFFNLNRTRVLYYVGLNISKTKILHLMTNFIMRTQQLIKKIIIKSMELMYIPMLYVRNTSTEVKTL